MFSIEWIQEMNQFVGMAGYTVVIISVGFMASTIVYSILKWKLGK